jgi:neutral ceramidase
VLEIGIGTVEITPKIGTPLSGFASRVNKPSTSVDSNLYVRAFVLRSENEARFIISYDLLGVGQLLEHQILDYLRNELSEVFDKEQCVLVTTHTHSAPPTIKLSGEVDPDIDYCKWVSSQTVKAAKFALHRVQPALLYMTSLTISGLTYNRRALVTDGSVSILPEPELPVLERGPLDDLMTVLLWRDLDGKNIAAIVHFPCHGVALLTQAIGGDIPGEICKRIGELLNVPCLFLQGAAGDINPTVLVSGREELETWMDKFMENIKGLESKLQLINQEPISFHKKTICVNYSQLSSRAQTYKLLRELEIISSGDFESQEVQGTMIYIRDLMHVKPDDSIDPVVTKHIAKALAINAKKSISQHKKMSTLDPSPIASAILRLGEIILVFIAAEVFAITGLRIKALHQRFTILPVGFLAPLIGYLPDAQSISIGGYEVDYAWRFYGHVAPFAHDSEYRVIQEVSRLISKINHDEVH